MLSGRRRKLVENFMLLIFTISGLDTVRLTSIRLGWYSEWYRGESAYLREEKGAKKSEDVPVLCDVI